MTYNGMNFNGTHATGTSIEVWLNWNSDLSVYWLSHRFCVLCKRLSGTSKLTVEFNNLIQNVEYNVDENGYVVVDLTDFIRTYHNDAAALITLYFDNPSSDSYSINLSGKSFGLIEPRARAESSPLRSRQLYSNEFLGFGCVIEPPSKILYKKDNYIGNNDLYIEFFMPALNIIDVEALGSGTVNFGNLGIFRVNIIADDSFKVLHYVSGTWVTLKEYHLETPDPCRSYAMVQWLSASGIRKQHIFYTSKQKYETDGAYELLKADNSYSQIKGDDESLTLYLDDLNAYDYWYYSDIINSSDVKIWLAGEWVPVQVKTKSVTIPDGDGGKWNKLEVEINYERYDAVAL